MIDRVTAILLISPNPKALAAFYRNALGLSLEDETHPGVPLHYGCDVGGVHLAIHANAGWVGVPTRDAQSPVVVLGTSNVRAIAERLAANGVHASGPTDHGFGLIVSFRDPDGNLVEILEERHRNRGRHRRCGRQVSAKRETERNERHCHSCASQELPSDRHPDEMRIMERYRLLAEHCAAEGWLRIEGPAG